MQNQVVCPNCKTVLKESDVFCPKCGTKARDAAGGGRLGDGHVGPDAVEAVQDLALGRLDAGRSGGHGDDQADADGKADSDHDATRLAQHLAGWNAVELWEGARLVARVSPQAGDSGTEVRSSPTA